MHLDHMQKCDAMCMHGLCEMATALACLGGCDGAILRIYSLMLAHACSPVVAIA